MHPRYAVCLFVLYKLRYRLYIFTGYRRVLPRYPILARAKNGVFSTASSAGAAAQIYGKNMARIRGMDQLARAAGRLIQNEIRELGD